MLSSYMLEVTSDFHSSIELKDLLINKVILDDVALVISTENDAIVTDRILVIVRLIHQVGLIDRQVAPSNITITSPTSSQRRNFYVVAINSNKTFLIAHPTVGNKSKKEKGINKGSLKKI